MSRTVEVVWASLLHLTMLSPVTLTTNVNNATYPRIVHTARKHSPEFDKQAQQTQREGQTRQASTPTREARRENRLPLETKPMVDGNNVI